MGCYVSNDTLLLASTMREIKKNGKRFFVVTR